MPLGHVVGDHSPEPVLSVAEGFVLDGGRKRVLWRFLDFARNDGGSIAVIYDGESIAVMSDDDWLVSTRSF